MKKLMYTFVTVALLSSTVQADTQKAVAKAPTNQPKVVAKAPAAPTNQPKVAAKVPAKKDFSNVKIASLDTYRTLESCDEWSGVGGIVETIRADMEKRGKKIEGMQAKLNKMKTEIQAMGNAATASAREKKQKEMLALETNIEIEKRALQEIPKQQAQMAQMEMFKKIEATAEKLREEHELDMVVASGVICVAERVDITPLIVEELNKAYAAYKAA